MSKNEENLKQITLDEVAEHKTEDSAWLVIGNATNGK